LMGNWPDAKSRFPVMIAWEYGPIAPGAFGVETLCLSAISELLDRRLDNVECRHYLRFCSST